MSASRPRHPHVKVLAAVLGVILASVGVIPGHAAPAPTRIKVAGTASKVDPGTVVTIFGRLISKQRACRSKQPIRLLESSSSGSVATGRTDARGRFAFEQTITTPASFRVRYGGKKGCKATTSRTITIEVFEPPAPMLQGSANSPAAEQIPEAPFPAARPGDFAFSDEVGTVLSQSELMVGFSPQATVAEVNSLLTEIGGTIVGGDPSMAWVLIRLEQPLSGGDMLALLDRLDANPTVDFAAPETPVAPVNTPNSPGALPDGPIDPQWTWEVPPTGGNWGLEVIRAPQAWNLTDTVEPFVVGVIDGGFYDDHPDLREQLSVETLGGRNPNPNVVATAPAPVRAAAQAARDHGTGTSGVVGARYQNYQFFDGVGGRLVRVVGLPARMQIERLVDDFNNLRTQVPAADVVNMSLGYDFDKCRPQRSLSWLAAGVSGTPAQQQAARSIVRAHARAYARLWPTPTNDLLVVAAGNSSDLDGSFYPRPATKCPPNTPPLDLDGDGRADNPGSVDIPGEWNHPACYAAAELNIKNILCVEAVRNDAAAGYPRANFSNNTQPVLNIAGGHTAYGIAAPGDSIPQIAGTNGFKVFIDGTSIAAPFVAGGLGWLNGLTKGLSEDYPGYQAPSMTALRDHVIEFSRPGGGNRVGLLDLSYATTALDKRGPGTQLRTDLLDVNDVSAFDGNARIDTDDHDGDGDRTEEFPAREPGEPFVRGDGKVDMRDFRAFRDAVLQDALLDRQIPGTQIELDGSTTHFKLDLNFDGCVGPARVHPPHIDIGIKPAPRCPEGRQLEPYPRYDFNGDGVLNGFGIIPEADELAPFNVVPTTACTAINTPTGCVRDIDVFDFPDFDGFEAGVFTPSQGAAPTTRTCDEFSWLPETNLFGDIAGRTSDGPDGRIDHIFSGDVHVVVERKAATDIDDVFIDVDSAIPDRNQTDDDGDGRIDEPFERSVSKCRRVDPTMGGTFVVTMPLFAGDVRVTVLGLDRDVDAQGNYTDDPYGFTKSASLKYGEDVLFVAKSRG